MHLSGGDLGAIKANSNSQLIGKDPDAGEDQGQKEKGATDGEMVG